MRLPDQLGPVTGWRLWRSVAGELRSLNDGVPWAPGVEAVARCKIDWSHDAPVPECSCGLYATKSPVPTRPLGRLISGPVGLWGRVVEHEDGYRAARAYPQALHVLEDFHCGIPFGADARSAATLRSYGVPVSVIPLAEIDKELVRAARLRQPYDGATDLDAAVRSARAMVDAGAREDAFLPVLEQVRRVDRRVLKWLRREPGDLLHYQADVMSGDTGSGLRRNDWVITLRGSMEPEFPFRRAPSEPSPRQRVSLDTKTGEIVERFEGCDVVGDDAHARVCPGREMVRMIRPGHALALETWIQVLGWMWTAAAWRIVDREQKAGPGKLARAWARSGSGARTG